MKHREEIRVRYSETDQMKIVYHANYLVWFEIARTEYFKKKGYSYKELEDRNIISPVVSVKLKYRYPAKYDDVVIVKSEMILLQKIKFKFGYRIIRKLDNKLLVTGETEHFFADRDMNALQISKVLPELLDKK